MGFESTPGSKPYVVLTNVHLYLVKISYEVSRRFFFFFGKGGRSVWGYLNEAEQSCFQDGGQFIKVEEVTRISDTIGVSLRRMILFVKCVSINDFI